MTVVKFLDSIKTWAGWVSLSAIGLATFFVIRTAWFFESYYHLATVLAYASSIGLEMLVFAASIVSLSASGALYYAELRNEDIKAAKAVLFKAQAGFIVTTIIGLSISMFDGYHVTQDIFAAAILTLLPLGVSLLLAISNGLKDLERRQKERIVYGSWVAECEAIVKANREAEALKNQERQAKEERRNRQRLGAQGRPKVPCKFSCGYSASVNNIGKHEKTCRYRG